MGIRLRHRRRSIVFALLGAAMWPAAACSGDADAPVRVGDITYTEAELLGLDQGQRLRLAVLTGFGAAIADGRLEELGEPRVEHQAESLVLQRLDLEQAALAAGLDEEGLRKAYLARPEEELVVRHLVVMSERWRPREHRDSAWARAKEALLRIHAGEPFEKVVAEYSDEPGAAERGGLLEPGTQDSWVPEFWAAAEWLSVGEVSPVVETRFGYHVLRLESRDTVPFEAVRDEVLPRLVDPTARFEVVETPPGATAQLDSAALALRRARLEEAAELRITASADELRALELEWRDSAARLAAKLGFEEGMTNQEVRQTALAALGAIGQAEALARAEVVDMEPLVRRLYPISVTEPAAEVSASSGTSARSG